MEYKDLKVGLTASVQKTFSEADITMFAGISLDVNPLHVSEAFAKKGIFGQRVVHGMLGASLISAVLANKLPGAGAIYRGQYLKFTAPIYIGDDITATVEIKELRYEKRIVLLKTTCTNEKGQVVISGNAVIKHNG